METGERREHEPDSARGEAGRSRDRDEVDRSRRDERPVLPGSTRDDTDEGWGERDGRDDNDRRLLEDRPPHWGSD